MIIDAVSDLHGYYPKLEGGDLLIVAGDLTSQDNPYQYIEFALWLDKQDYKKKIVIAGNHDNILQECLNCIEAIPNTQYLCDSGTEFEGLKIWGSPWTLNFKGQNPKCKAFGVDTEEELAAKWRLIPNDIDILITHSPAFFVLDGIPGKDGFLHVGSTTLGLAINRIHPRLHVVGHIHEQGGKEEMVSLDSKYQLKCVNASIVNERYQHVNKPIRITL